MVKGNTTAEEQALLEQLVNDTHISTVGSIAVVGARGPNGRVGIIVLNSCCGTSAYEMTMEMMQEVIVALTGCTTALDEQVH